MPSQSLLNYIQNPLYVTTGDITEVVKTTSGKVVFYKGTTPLCAVTEKNDINIEYGDGSIFFLVDNRFLYEFTFWSLTDINGRPFSAIINDGSQTAVASYQAKVRDVFEELNTNIFVGCCNSGGGTDSVEFYDDLASFPLTGDIDILYVAKDTGITYVWDGSGYITGGSTGVQTVTGDSVNNTDPSNPIVNAIPLSGTTVGNPVTGLIQLEGGQIRGFYQNDGITLKEILFEDDDNFFIRSTLISTGENTAFNLKYSSLTIFSNFSSFQGVEYAGNYSANFNIESLISQRVLKSRLWNKAGAPTTTDDSIQGYIVGSLIFDTTNSILYRCTDNTPSAATWEVYYDPKTTIQSITISGASVTTTANTAQDITGLVTPTLPANSVWFFEIDMLISCTGTGGVRLGFTAPSGATGQLSVIGTGTSLTSYLQTSTTGALPAIAMNRFNGGSYVRMTGRVKIGATAGAVQLQFASGTSGQTSTIFGDFESVMNLKRLL